MQALSIKKFPGGACARASGCKNFERKNVEVASNLQINSYPSPGIPRRDIPSDLALN